MNIFDRILNKGKKKAVTPATGSTAQGKPGSSAFVDSQVQLTSQIPSHASVQPTPAARPSLIEQMDHFTGIADLFALLRDHSASEIEQVCREFPIETLHLDYDSLTKDFRNSQRFELVTFLAQILVRYNETRDENPESNLPESLPAGELAEILMSRLIPFINGVQGMELAQSLRVRLYDFAMGLLRAYRQTDALACLRASYPSIKDDHDFWICATLYNIANTTKKPEDITAFVESAEAIVSGKVKVPDRAMPGVKKMLADLKG